MWVPKVRVEVLSVADTGTVVPPKVPVIGVPEPFAPTASTKYSAAAIVVAAEVLTVAFRFTEAAPFVGFGLTTRPLVTGPGGKTVKVMS